MPFCYSWISGGIWCWQKYRSLAINSLIGGRCTQVIRKGNRRDQKGLKKKTYLCKGDKKGVLHCYKITGKVISDNLDAFFSYQIIDGETSSAIWCGWMAREEMIGDSTPLLLHSAYYLSKAEVISDFFFKLKSIYYNIVCYLPLQLEVRGGAITYRHTSKRRGNEFPSQKFISLKYKTRKMF